MYLLDTRRFIGKLNKSGGIMFKRVKAWWNNPDKWKPKKWDENEFKNVVVIDLFIIILLLMR